MLILGFEKEELEAKSANFFGELRNAKGGFDFWAWFETEHLDIRARPTLGDKLWTWRCRAGDCTEGTHSLVADVSPPPGGPPHGIPFRSTPYLSKYYPVPGKETRVVLQTYQWLTSLPSGYRDWSACDRLLMDVRLTVESRVRLWVEDGEIEPPVVRSYEVPAGNWVTLEMDLDRAARERGLDLKEIVNFWVTVNPKGAGRIRIDNIRVERGGSEARLPVLRDPSPMVLEPRRLPARPVAPENAAGARDAAPVKLAAPIRAGAGSVVPLGWLVAIDNRRMLLGYTRPGTGPAKKAGARFTLDGGATWREAVPPVVRNLDHGTSQGCDLDWEGTAAAVSSGPGCAGHKPTPRQWLTRYVFDGTGWKAELPAVPIAADIRHCGSNASMLRVRHGPRAGRLWHVMGQIDRRHSLSLHASFSDDGGLTWWPWGRGGLIPGSRESDWTTNTYCYQRPNITEYRGHIACFWQDRRGLLWTFFDGEKWAEPAAIDARASARLEVTALESFRVPGSAATLGAEEIFVTAWNVPGVLRWDGRSWRREIEEAPDAGKLSVCGDQVFLFTAGHVPEPPPWKQIRVNRYVEVRCYRRDPRGRWHGPFLLSPGGKVSILFYRQMPALVAPRYPPPDFVPVAWSDGRTIELLRIPADISKGF
ncbi:MAG: hypothetical protein N3A38_06570 [Planctomycetota bacterium]|nr:hypothetical protein [Planctomycetota bacterium]